MLELLLPAQAVLPCWELILTAHASLMMLSAQDTFDS